MLEAAIVLEVVLGKHVEAGIIAVLLGGRECAVAQSASR
jgi:hypothetical protein